jgi:hypothetical protein
MKKLQQSNIIQSNLPTELKFDKKNRTLEHYISSERVNEYGYKLRTKGMDEKDYRDNPQVLYLHFAGSSFFGAPARPSDTIIGTNLKLTKHKDGFLSAVTQFAESDLGEEVMQFNIAGYLNAWSLRWGWNDVTNYEDDIEEKEGIYTVLNWRLKEYSSVPLPANPDATNKLALQQMLSESKVSILQQSLSESLIKIETDEHFEILSDRILSIENQLKDSDENQITKKDLTDLKAEIKSQQGDIKKSLTEQILSITLSNFNFRTNLDKRSLIKMEEVAQRCIDKYVGKLRN